MGDCHAGNPQVYHWPTKNNKQSMACIKGLGTTQFRRIRLLLGLSHTTKTAAKPLTKEAHQEDLEPSYAWDKFFEAKHAQSEEVQELLSKLVQDFQSINEELAEYINTPNWNLPTSSYDDDEDYTIAITPVLSTKEPVDSLIMEDEHLDTILATKLDEVIKSNVEDFVQIPSESEGIPDNMCDVPFRDNSPPLDISKDQFKGFSDSNNDSTSIYDDSFSIDDIDYVEASPPDSELVSLEEAKDFHTEDGEIEDDILREKLSKINLLIAKIEAINSNLPLSSNFVTKSSSTSLNFFLEETNTFDNSLTESEIFCFDLEENSSGSTTTHADFPQYDSSDSHLEEFADELAHVISPPEYDCFYFKSEPDLGELTSIVDSGIRENVLSMTNVNLPFEDDQSPLLAYVVWIFLPFLTIARIFEASRARGFVLRSLELHILSFILGIQYPNLID
ncbi:hypothetical protein Tco_0289513 [Tanacetum coccineum]